LKGEPAAAEVERILGDGHGCTLTVLGVAEVVDHLVRLVGAEEEEVVLDLAQFGLLSAPLLDADSGLRGGRLRTKHYHRSSCAISLADCVAADLARAVDGRLATADPHLLDVCEAEAIGRMALPDSTGATWVP
jgi:predicted nucleic acid-binding protein